MELKKIKLRNFRSFGSKEQVIDIDDITVFIGNNSAGKTSALAALNYIFSNASLTRGDFHLPKDKSPEDMDIQDLSIEVVFSFEELKSETDGERKFTIPIFCKSFVVDGPNDVPYLRIRLEATWEKSTSLEGAIDYRIFFITCPEDETITDDNKKLAQRRLLDQIRVIYIPAVRNPTKQLHNISGTMMHQIMQGIEWSENFHDDLESELNKINDIIAQEPGIPILQKSIAERWAAYDSDTRYNNADLRFNSTNVGQILKNTDVVFSPTATEREYSIDEMGDGLRSLFYISLVDSLLSVESYIRTEQAKEGSTCPFNRHPPIKTIIALEEPENHISPHLLGKLITNLKSIADKQNAQIILTSHSPSIVKRIDPEHLRYFRLKEHTVVRKITLPDEEKFADQRKFVKEAVCAYPELYFAKLVVLGEGDSEEILLPKFLSLQNEGIDCSGISVVPLGGRYVNHFWRLLNNLKIPFITLLDLDLERDGGGWGRIKYVLNQLIALGVDKKELLKTSSGILSDEELGEMHNWDVSDIENLKNWINFLKDYNVFFSAPLDIDFLMLRQFELIYKSLISSKEGPFFYIQVDGKRKKKYVATAENEAPSEEYNEKVKTGIRATLKEFGGDGSTYSDKQKRLMVWYNYFFLQRGKPTTHIEALSKIDDDTLLARMPPVFKEIRKRAEEILSKVN